MEQDKHLRMAEKRKVGHEKKKARATSEKGLLIVNTGTGKGKTTAALGMAVRAVAHGMKLGVVQFIKGAMQTGERDVFDHFENVDWHTIGDGFTWNTQNRDQDVETAQRAWQEVERMLDDPTYDMILLDELNVILKYAYLPPEEVISRLANKREDLHVIVTGRNAPAELIEVADLVSDIKPVKHPFKEQGIRAQAGIEF